MHCSRRNATANFAGQHSDHGKYGQIGHRATFTRARSVHLGAVAMILTIISGLPSYLGETHRALAAGTAGLAGLARARQARAPPR